MKAIRAVPLIAIVLAAGCAQGFDPKPIESVGFRDRAQTQVDRGIRVTSAVPSSSEARDLFGISLYRKGIQPVWVEIENSTDEPVTFMPIAVDRDYHSPLEVAALNRRQKSRAEAQQHFFRNGVDLFLDPGETRSGFVFTNLDEGTKAFNVDLVSQADVWRFTFFIQVPGLAVDHYDVDFDAIYAGRDVVDFSEPDPFIAALSDLPCCTNDKSGENLGDPLNLVLIGQPIDLYYAFLRSGWDQTEVVTAFSGWKTAVSFFTGGEYRYSPVSSLYVFGRRQDIALQRIRDNIHERNHFRLWLAPMTYEGLPVFIGQISRDIGVRFTSKTITTHKIDPDVDETREFLVENLAYNQVLDQFAYVPGVGAASIDDPRANLTGDPYFTDGHRAVLWIGPELTDLQDVRFLDWMTPDRKPTAVQDASRVESSR